MKKILILIVCLLLVAEMIALLYFATENRKLINKGIELEQKGTEFEKKISDIKEEVKYGNVFYNYLGKDFCSIDNYTLFFRGVKIHDSLKADFTYWGEIGKDEKRLDFANKTGVIIPAVDFNKSTVIVSFERKIVQMRKRQSASLHSLVDIPENPLENETFADVLFVTFSEERYDGEIFYYEVFTPGKHSVGDAFVFSAFLSPYYILNDGQGIYMAEKVLIQKSDIELAN